MSEPLVDATTPSHATTSFLLDGELPRLGRDTPAPAPFAAPPATAPAAITPAPRAAAPSPMLTAPGSAPVLGTPESPGLPTLPTTPQPPTPQPPTPATDASTPAPVDTVTTAAPAPDLPTLPTVAPTVHHATPSGETPTGTGTDEHPMAHLMPQKSAPSEASTRAAELRAAKKAKRRKIKIGVAIGAIAVTAVVGPPLGKWFVDAINEAGSTSTEVEG
jgi:hypothetical protein